MLARLLSLLCAVAFAAALSGCHHHGGAGTTPFGPGQGSDHGQGGGCFVSNGGC